MTKKAIGKGLDALLGIPQNSKKETRNDEISYVSQVSPQSLNPSPLQPRTQFTESPLNDLVDSIRQHGIIQPLIIRKKSGKDEIIAGERRWRAAKQLKLKKIPVIYSKANDQEVLEMALIENLQRENLNPIEEAQGYISLIEDFQLSQKEISKHVGKSRASIANMIRLLSLPQEVQKALNAKKISVGHAKALLSLRNKEKMKELNQKIIQQDLTVRSVERLVKQVENSSPRSYQVKRNVSSSLIKRIADILSKHLMTRVSIKHSEKKGKIEIEYYGNEDFNRILQTLGINDKEI